MISIVKLGFK